MGESDWLLAGLIIGVLVGVPLGYLLAQIVAKPSTSSVVFDRDREGRISGIHLVPIGVKN
jgi:hypothetical protein